MAKITNRETVAAIHNGEPFVTRNETMHARYVRSESCSRGIMPNAAVDMLRSDLQAAHDAGEPLYVVYSYETPIAWGREGDLLKVPSVRYSNTTSRHQSYATGGVVGGRYVVNGERVAVK